MMIRFNKIVATFIALFFLIPFFSRSQNLNNELTKPRKVLDCEVVTLNALDKLVEQFSANRYDSVKLIIKEWTKFCGISECTQRLSILNSILNHETSIDSITSYFKNDFYYVLKNRIYYSHRFDYGYYYTESKSYFGYVPLRHPIDSISMQKSAELLESKTLTPDERLICILFSGDDDQFQKKIKEREYKESFIRNYVAEEYRDYGNRIIAYTLYSGIYTPVGSNRIFNNSPVIGVTFSSPLNYKFIVELGLKLRINVGDKTFQYYALKDTN
ncbi:MAG: hypothetical protein ABUL44_00570, partial [Flavobacterium sp.]